MENYIENKPKLFKKIGSKFLAVLSILMIGIVMMLCLGTTANAAEVSIEDKTKFELYDTKWNKANINFYCLRTKLKFGFIPVFDRTQHYLRITDKNGNFINNITHLAASFIISSSGKEYVVKVDKEITSDYHAGIFTVGNYLDKEGQFQKNTSSKSFLEKQEFYDIDGKKVEYEECNYMWMWNWYVKEITYLYVWYIDPTTGEQVAGSFMPNGEHPMYNEDGTLKGIYDLNDNKVEDVILNDYGVPSKVENLPNGEKIITPLVKPNGQLKGEGTVKTNKPNWWDDLFPGTGDDDDDKGLLYYIVLIIKLIIYLLIIATIFKIISFIIGLFKNK